VPETTHRTPPPVPEQHARSSRLRAVDLALGYGDEPIITDLSAAVPDRSFTVIIGPNACGKSTLLRGLSRQGHRHTSREGGRPSDGPPATDRART
jgi:ABC-type phosphate transport system ATPase subunit